ncbi:MAG TPA: endolytic transglycosylase MltG [Solirubrobacterales bacterium]|nr:endolytic transglycosylase MltG [Solirubrobacterales bacterium]
MADRDWQADTEGNLTPPGGRLEPETDEFGRTDPASLERERRRWEREARRSKQRPDPTSTAEAPRPERPTKPKEPIAPPPPADPGGDGGDPERPPRLDRGRRGPYRRRRIFALGLLLLGVLVAWFLIAFFQPPPFDPGEGSGQAIVTVPEGASASQVADLLTDNEVVSNGTLFEWRLQLAGKADQILPGRYVLAQDMSYSDAIDRLTSSGGKINVTIPEGEDRTQIAATVGDLGLSGDYLAATKSVNGFDPNRYGAQNPKSLEGFLFPATYELDPGASVDQLVSEQLEAFRQNTAGVNMSYAKSKNLTVYDVLTIASMIDKEVMVSSERRLVAAVIYNRLSRGMPLGIDATTRFEFHNYTDEITQSQLQSPSPYNTRTHVGLPPTPIGNPGLAAIEAAARPAKVNYLFYVVNGDGSGSHCFTASEQEFNQLVTAANSGRATPNCRS